MARLLNRIVLVLICCCLSACGIQEKVTSQINNVFSHEDTRAEVTVVNQEAALLSYTWYAASDSGFGNLSPHSGSVVRMEILPAGESVRIELNWSSGHDRVMYVNVQPKQTLRLDIGIAPVLAN